MNIFYHHSSIKKRKMKLELNEAQGKLKKIHAKRINIKWRRLVIRSLFSVHFLHENNIAKTPHEDKNIKPDHELCYSEMDIELTIQWWRNSYALHEIRLQWNFYVKNFMWITIAHVSSLPYIALT